MPYKTTISSINCWSNIAGITVINIDTQYISLLYKLVRSYTLRQKIKLIKKFHDSPDILDYGCGTGHFIEQCKSQKWTYICSTLMN